MCKSEREAINAQDARNHHDDGERKWRGVCDVAFYTLFKTMDFKGTKPNFFSGCKVQGSGCRVCLSLI